METILVVNAGSSSLKFQVFGIDAGELSCVVKGQIDGSARVIWALEKLGWAWDVRWPSEDRIRAKRIDDYGGEKTLVAP